MKRVWLALTGLLVAAGCQAPGSGTAPASHSAFECRPGGPACEVTVTVTACNDKGISVDRDAIRLKRNFKNVPITWHLRSSVAGTEFAGNGIWFKHKTDQFQNGLVVANGQQYKWVGLNTKPTTAGPEVHAYGIKVIRNGTACAEMDPSVINDGSDYP